MLAHVEEMLPFWLGEIERILDGTGATPVPFGRVATDPVRIGIIGRDRTVPLRELSRGSGRGRGAVAARLRALDADGDADRVGLHPTPR